MQLIDDYASSIGYRFTYDLPVHLERDGDTDVHERVIRIRPGMLRRRERSVKGHELAHATLGDQPTIFGYYNDRMERLADEWAARFLIVPDAFREAEEVCCGHTEAMAIHLDVMSDIVVAYRRQLARLGDTVYVRPRMGAGQWAERVTA